MVEWFKAAVLKTAVAQVTEGSNPSFSAIFFVPSRFFKSESVCPVIAKTRLVKGFYKIYPRVLETHSDRKIRVFSPVFCPLSV